MTDQTLAWFGNPELKAQVVAKMKQHRAQDEIVQCNYQIKYGSPFGPVKYKGCAIGCTLPYVTKAQRMASTGGYSDDFDWHDEVEKRYGIDAQVAYMIDEIFELQDDFQDAADFAVAVIEAIPVGADLSNVPNNIWTPGKFIEALATAPVPEPSTSHTEKESVNA